MMVVCNRERRKMEGSEQAMVNSFNLSLLTFDTAPMYVYYK
jgi:hypothetical protein